MVAQQRRFRVDVLGAGFTKYGHLLDLEGVERGANFLHPAALACARARMALGKGVAHERTFGNMLASQTMGFNLFGPLAASDDGLALAAKVLAPFVRGLASVRTIALEHTPDPDVFGDQSGRAGVDADVLVEFVDRDGAQGVDFLGHLATAVSPSAANVARKMLAWASVHAVKVWWGQRPQGSFTVIAEREGDDQFCFALFAYGSVEIPFQYMAASPGPFRDEALRDALRERLNAIPGVRIERDALAKRPSFPARLLDEPSAWEAFAAGYEWYLGEIGRAGP